MTPEHRDQKSDRPQSPSTVRRFSRLPLIAIMLLGCSTEPSEFAATSHPPLAPPPPPDPPPPPAPPPPPPVPSSKPALSIVTVVPENGATISGTAMVRALLSYRLGTGDRGRIVVVIICVKDGKLVCVDAGTIAFLTRHEGGVEVTFPVQAPAGAGIGIALELLEEGIEQPLARVSLNYRAAP